MQVLWLIVAYFGAFVAFAASVAGCVALWRDIQEKSKDVISVSIATHVDCIAGTKSIRVTLVGRSEPEMVTVAATHPGTCNTQLTAEVIKLGINEEKVVDIYLVGGGKHFFAKKLAALMLEKEYAIVIVSTAKGWQTIKEHRV